jgi:hypothetical protein
MPWPVHPTGFFGARGDSDTYRIERSLRFNSADSAYLNRTPANAGNRKTWTFSAWIKLGSTNPTIATPLGTIFSGSNGGPSLFNSSGLRICHANDPAGTDSVRMTSAIVRDPSAWYHVVWWCDTTQVGTRWKIYINGIEQTLETPSGYNGEPAQNTDLSINSTAQHLIGQYAGSYFDGYMAEVNFIDSQALTPSFFGETDAITGRWKAKAYSGTYGTNGFYLKFADNSGTTATTLGKDSSSNGNNWTPNNFSVTAGAGNDSLVDSPTNYGTDTGVGGEVRGNYCTLNPLATFGGTLSNGNLEYISSGAWRASPSTILIPSSGKWYFEGTLKGNPIGTAFAQLSAGIGIIAPPAVSAWSYNSGTSFYVSDSGHYSNYNVGSSGSFLGNASGTVIGLSIDRGANTVTIYQNGVSKATVTLGITSGSDIYAFNGSGDVTNGQMALNFGQRPFAYTAPSGFKALCTQNLTQPTIQKPSRYMDALAYTGTGASNAISSLGFSPDLVWIKNRGTTTSHAIYDTTRGAQSQLSSDTTGDQVTSSSGLTSFDANGFTIGNSTLVNTSGTQYVAWSWDESVQAGMDIVSYTGNGANRTISHNLGVAPKMIIVKARTTAGADQGWPVWHTSIANTTYLGLNSTSATATGSDYWNSTSPTSSVFSLGANAAVNANNDTYISYLFSEIEGYSKFGSYAGNASADGPFVWCGFKPKYIMVKKTSATGPWMVFDSSRDSFNVATSELRPNETTAEPIATRGSVDLLSNGFKIRSTSATYLGELGDFVFAAFAESPFKYARAR